MSQLENISTVKNSNVTYGKPLENIDTQKCSNGT